ncbi:MAG: ABC transporter substrate-binding protein [Thermomicrobiales bacterium]|nr:ABC transporter substrate-binding protein [Thermomicrobiales bacterium]
MIRLTPIPGKPIDPSSLGSVDDLVQARIDGRLSRRDLIRRAAQLGFAAPVIGVMLHATSDMVNGAPSPGRNRAIARMQDVPIMVEGPTAPEGTQVAGGALVVGTTDEPDTLHPALTQLQGSFDVWGAIVKGLLHWDSAMVMHPELATEFSISDDGLSYTFSLREGVTFHNGDPFAAADVMATVDIINNPDFGTYNVYNLDQVAEMSASEDGLTITLSTAEPYAPFLSLIADGPIFPKAEIDKGLDSFTTEYGRAPVGAGPLRFVEWAAQQHILLERFDDYWGDPSILDEIRYMIIPDDNTQLVQLRTGEIQLVGGAGAISALRVDEALEIEGVNVLQHSSQAWIHLDLKHVDFLRMTKVRQALDYATPTQQIIDQLMGGRVLPSIGDVPPGSWAFNPDVEPRPYDPDRAKELLEEAGLTFDGNVWSGPTPTPEKDIDPNTDLGGPVKELAIEIWTQAGESHYDLISQAIAQSWSDIGIKVEVKTEDVSTIWGPEGYQFTDAMTAALFAWYNSNDPDDTWYWHSKWIPETPEGSGGNLPAYFFPYNFQAEIDDLTGRAETETDQEARAELYRQAQALLHEEAAVIFLYWDMVFPAVAENVGGFWPSGFTNLFWNAHQWYVTE